MRQTCYFHESQEDKFFQLISDVSKNVTNFHVISKDMIIMEWEHNRNYVPDDTKANVFIAAFTTCWARLKLYGVLEMLDQRVLYMDTDSCIYISKAGLAEPQLGDYLGQLTNELNPGEHIVEFVTTGPKSYAYLTNKGTQECKVRGFSLKSYTNSKLIDFDLLKQIIIKDQSRYVDVCNDRKICRDKKSSILYNRKEVKRYKMVFTKRVIGNYYNTFPYGY
ncbi:uncharacterized protein LOC123561229 [Mercenaria mercenaria]|uniref:uncharacterized protein LOC123561229 n=1 Tax=Mercenaria mercenaria TaxID=6596 RepID=UPI00234EDADC|nr:uncharacterized protein LOC123561229 [Mercenaria mercenaria]